MSCKDTFSFGEFRKRARCAKGKGKVAASSESGGGATLDKWIKMLPDKKEPLYSHSLPCIEAWLTSLGFVQSKEDRAVWRIEKPDWRAQLSLDITDLYIRYQNFQFFGYSIALAAKVSVPLYWLVHYQFSQKNLWTANKTG
ncbi:hypothetical protein SUGI_0507530 [Cryptomeria japonica]|nr:hypothetical protein SUGI_0507530 [Cryptomeria japonica]